MIAEPALVQSRLTCMLTEFLVALSVPALAFAADKPRVFVTESQPIQVSAERKGDGRLAFSGGTTKENVEVMKGFVALCPDVVVTSSRDKASYVVRLDHEAINPTTPFVRGNKVAVFNKDEDLIYSGSTRLLKPAVKGACAAIVAAERK